MLTSMVVSFRETLICNTLLLLYLMTWCHLRVGTLQGVCTGLSSMPHCNAGGLIPQGDAVELSIALGSSSSDAWKSIVSVLSREVGLFLPRIIVFQRFQV